MEVRTKVEKKGEEKDFVSQFLKRLSSKLQEMESAWNIVRFLYAKSSKIENFPIVNLIAILKQYTYFYIFP